MKPMNAEDQERLKHLTAPLPTGIRLHLALTGHTHSGAFQEFCRQLIEIAPGLDLSTETSADPEPPWIETANGIRFHALPEGDKLDSFVEALTPSAAGAALPAEHQALLDGMPLPTDVRLFIAPGCPFCPKVLHQWTGLAKGGERLRLHVVDGTLFPEMALAANVKAVPTLVVDSELRWSGRIPVGEVLEQIVSRDPARLSPAALDGIIREGLAEQVARTMIARGVLFPAIADLLTDDKWPVRLGAMVVMEEIAEVDRQLAGNVVPLLQQRYDGLDDAARGDVIYMIGATGDHRILTFLGDVAAVSPSAEIRQAAAEAIAAIEAHDAAQSEAIR